MVTETGADIGDSAVAVRHVDAVVGRSGTSFFWAMRLLPRPRREAMFAVYAFCREVDDIADDEAAVPLKRAQLGRWRE
ncbi:MAG: squalene/phytoene synthase family protein, partial [Dongiaceae bacterium]